MLSRILRASLWAGLAAGVVAWGLHLAMAVPLILRAETYEAAAQPAAPTAAAGEPAGHGDGHDHDRDRWAPADGVERALYTLAADLVTAVGFALLLLAAVAASGRRVDAREGLVWGLAGFAAFSLAPSVGLPPELPGMAAAELAARQVWWAMTAVATAGGLAVAAFAPAFGWRALGIVLVALPHVWGAPMGHAEGAAVPAELAAEFVAATLAASAIFWLVLGGLAGHFWRRSAPA